MIVKWAKRSVLTIQAFRVGNEDVARPTAPRIEGGWRAEKRKILMARALRHAGAFRRANRSVFRHWALL